MLKKLTQQQQDAILERAVEEFGRDGLERASVSEIARRSGVSVGVIYKYYKNKEELFRHCLTHSIAMLSEVMEGAVSGEETLMGACEKLIRACITASKEHAPYIQMYHAITHTQEGAKTYAEAIESATAQTYTKLLELAQAEGEVRADLDPALGAMFFDNLLMMLHFSYGCAYYEERMKLYDPSVSEEELVRQLVLFVKGALGAGKERS